MDSIIDILVKAGYFRARISNISDFDKIIGAIAWAIQAFSYGIEINVFYADTMDLGQKIALTERLVMVLIAMKCPHPIEPHQIVGLDHENLLPVLEWLIEKSSEKRRQLDALSRLLALRRFHKVTGTSINESQHNHSMPIISSAADLIERDPSLGTAPILATRIAETIANNERVSRDDVAAKLYGKSIQAKYQKSSVVSHEDEPEGSTSSNTSRPELQVKQTNTKWTGASHIGDKLETTDFVPAAPVTNEPLDVHKELDTEIIATNQKILEILKKLDCMPRDLEISQYQRRYIELHQNLISKNKDIKKLYALFNTLSSSKDYLLKEINLLDSLELNLNCIRSSSRKRNEFLHQFRDIATKIKAARDEVMEKRAAIRFSYNCLQAEYKSLLD